MAEPQTIYLKDYKAPSFKVSKLKLHFDLGFQETLVTADFDVCAIDDASELHLDGIGLELVSIKIDGKPVAAKQYTLNSEALILHKIPSHCQVTVQNKISPEKNTALEGLYQGGGMLCTQNEPQGFRHITYFLDRPDVMTCYETTICGDKNLFPVMLSNGNLIDSKELSRGRHQCTWEDPFPKPTYLFALVGGKLDLLQDHFTTMSGRKILLEIYCDPGFLSQCKHAMEALKMSMEWDEKRFRLEYDLDRYMIVAVDSFNMGAMENKGLNIFNSSCVFAEAKTATDQNFKRVEEVISHEYFHNWTGNRVTCRDWFQLTLKEGLTVFRDQEFTSDIHSRAVERISQAHGIEDRQFVEDAGPMAHPIKPSKYIEINNFYSSTVYRKGAEVIRMVHTMIGEEKFQKGMDLYFERHDGQAVTTEDFLDAMENASEMDLTQFKRWYSQAGTPKVFIDNVYDAEKKQAKILIRQRLDKTPYGGEQKPLFFPFKMTFYDSRGKEVYSEMVHIQEEEQEILIDEAHEELIPSLNENFTAPVEIIYSYTLNELKVLSQFAKDPYSRWKASKKLIEQTLFKKMQGQSIEEELEAICGGMERILKDTSFDEAYKAEVLSFPSINALFNVQKQIQVKETLDAYESLEKQVALRLYELFQTSFKALSSDSSYEYNSNEMGRRALRNCCLSFLVASQKEEAVDRAVCELTASNMTEELGALTPLSHLEDERVLKALETFYQKWKSYPLVVNKWLTLIAASKRKDTFERVKALVCSERFDNKVPNQVRALIGVFAANPFHFHDESGKAYAWLIDQIISLDSVNAQIASSLINAFNRVHKLDQKRSEFMVYELKRLLAHKLSKDSFEIASKTLKMAQEKEQAYA